MEDERFDDETEIREEHSAIRALMKWIERDLAVEARSPEGISGRSALTGPLRSFREHLERHFEFEERCGVIEAALLTFADAESLIHEWRQQHVILIRRIDACVETLERSARTGKPVGPEFAADLRGVFVDLRHHDALENRALGGPRATELRESQSNFERCE